MEDFDKNPKWENQKKKERERIFFCVLALKKKNEAIFLIFLLALLLSPWMVFSFSVSIAE